MFDTKRFYKTLILSSLITPIIWIILWYTILKHSSGWINSSSGYLYNIPITYILIILTIDLSLSFQFSRQWLVLHGAILMAWFTGLILLYFRLIDQSLEASGHMIWHLIFIVHLIIKQYPKWFLIIIVLIAVKDLYFNLYIFPSNHTGINGLLIGVLLSILMYIIHKQIIKTSMKQRNLSNN